MAGEEFGFDGNTSEGNDFNFITVSGKEDAVREDITLEDLKVDKWEDGRIFLEVTVKNAAGQTANGRYSQPKIDGTYIKTPEDLKKANDKFNKIAKNIATKVLGDNAVLTGKSFEDFCNTLIAKVKAVPNWNKTKLRALFSHNKDGYTKLRAFAPIFELMSIPKEQSKLVPGEFDRYVEKQAPSIEDDALPETPVTDDKMFG